MPPMASSKPDVRAMTIRLSPSTWRKLHAFCVEQSAEKGRMISLSIGVGILIDRLPEPESFPSSAPKSKKKRQEKAA